MKKSIQLCVFLPLFLLSACGGGMSGKYSDKDGNLSYTFKSDGTVIVDALGIKSEMKYKVDGNTVKLEVGGGSNLVFTKVDKGCLDTGFVGKVCPEK